MITCFEIKYCKTFLNRKLCIINMENLGLKIKFSEIVIACK